MDAFGLGKISVGPPYFNAVFAPLMLALAFLLGLGPRVRWKGQEAREVGRLLGWSLPLSILAGTLAALTGGIHLVATAAGFSAAFWVLAHTALAVRDRLRHARSGATAARRLPAGFLGMVTAHVGFAVCIIGVTAVSQWGVERDIRLAIGEATELGGYRFTLAAVREIEGPNYRGVQGSVLVETPGATGAITLYPEKRVYRAGGAAMTEAGIAAGLTRDLLASLGEPRGESAWTMRVQVKPFQRWIWLGGVCMALGGILAASDRRYRLRVRSPAGEALAGLARPA
jgi:cytochrome c-type biogenesis protein CcmF